MKSRIYAIGDIHGRADLLRPLLAHIRAEGEASRTIFLGDLIDRGPDSRSVLDMVAAHLDENAHSHLVLGNHDWFLREFLLNRLGAVDLQRWVDKYGAVGALQSYGITDPAADWNATRRHVLEGWPAHCKLLEAALHYLVDEHLCFVHAGLRPGVPLAAQTVEDLMWIKADFLDYRGPFEHFVVHGHTPTASDLPEIHANRIALDTHAFKSGHLTAAAFDDGVLSHFMRTTMFADCDIALEPFSVPI